MRIQLCEHFDYKKLLRFVFPSIAMMVFGSVYGIVDGLFVSNIVGKTPFAALNLIYPFIAVLSALGFMIGAGGNAIVSKTLGEGNREKANQYFSMLIYVSVVLGIAIAVLGIATVRPISILLGAEGEEMIENCVIYGTIIFAGIPFFMLQNAFQIFFITAERPNYGFYTTVAAGCGNMVLDWLFMAVFEWGIAGAALATIASQFIGAVIPIVYFSRKHNSSLLRLGKGPFVWNAFWKTCTNGSSEFVSNVSGNIVAMLYNFQLMRFAGEDGVAAYGVLMYVNWIFVAGLFGYVTGAAPIVGYHYGAQNHDELKNLFKKSMILMAGAGVALAALTVLLADVLSGIFVGYDQVLFEMTKRAVIISAVAFIFIGLNIFGSGFFTALNNGLISAAISFLRTVVFQVAAVMILPEFWEIDGIWWSMVVSEVLSFAVTMLCLVKYRKRYHYM
ncbi:MAG: MATE family efflux transporter [Oscillospiraceae bacterium]|nr:MATE family efflux transporter [Oscillospiraceae bacterium]MBQ3561037.1 MATE family efflux transporter [Oscillospiraceae bacterium]MBQ6699323.1 MATE family efflux transporter [Oscillospiraceae bacterium]